MKNVNWWKWGVIAIIVLALMYWARSCGIKSVLKTVGSDTTITKDSIQIKLFPFPVPYKIDSMVFVKGADGKPYPVYDTLWSTQEVIAVADTAAILARYYETAHYQHIVDTGRWRITVDESITQNRIKNWSLKAVSSDTTTVNTVQLKQKKPIRIMVAGSVGGNMKNPLFGQGAGGGIKLPNDVVVLIQYKNIQGHRPGGEVTVAAPISEVFKAIFKKRN